MSLKISHLEGLHYGYISRYILNNIKTGTIKPITLFACMDSDDFKLPVTVSGRLITSGVYYEPKYGQIEVPREELRKAHKMWVGKDIFKYHDAYWNVNTPPTNMPIDAIVGKITKTIWNDYDGAIDYVADIYDRDIAYKIYSRLIKNVSAGFSNDVVKIGKRLMKVDIEPKELSLVYRPKDKRATVNIANMVKK